MTILQNYPLLWLLAFAAGIGVGVGVYFAALRGRTDKEPVARAPLTDSEKRIHGQVATIIDRKLTDRNLSIKEIAADLNLTPQSIARIFKRHTGQNFRDCLMRSRIEVAKERLRSSNCPEATVAETCGFRSSAEMTRHFWRFLRTTPAKYRMEQQVT